MSHGYSHTTKHLRHVTVGRRTRTRTRLDDPLVQGGQGRSDQEVEDAAAGCAVVGGATALLAVAGAVWLAIQACGGLS